MPSLSTADKVRRGSPLSAPLTWPRSWLLLLKLNALWTLFSWQFASSSNVASPKKCLLSLIYIKATKLTEVRPNFRSDYASHQNNFTSFAYVKKWEISNIYTIAMVSTIWSLKCGSDFLSFSFDFAKKLTFLYVYVDYERATPIKSPNDFEVY